MREKRKFGRIPFGVIVTLIADNREYRGTLHDLSLNGAKILLDAPEAPVINTACRLRLPLASNLTLEFEGKIAHASESIVGLHFTETDPESFGHLIRLMELNTGDSDKVYDELHHIE